MQYLVLRWTMTAQAYKIIVLIEFWNGKFIGGRVSKNSQITIRAYRDFSKVVS